MQRTCSTGEYKHLRPVPLLLLLTVQSCESQHNSHVYPPNVMSAAAPAAPAVAVPDQRSIVSHDLSACAPVTAPKPSATSRNHNDPQSALFFSPYNQPIIALPFFFFSLESLLAIYCFRVHGDSDWMLKMMFSQLLAINSVHTGLTHLFSPFLKFYKSMIFLPYPKLWLHSTGFIFILSGLAVAFSKTQVIGAFVLCATFLFFLPFYLYTLISAHPRNEIFQGSFIRAFIRLLFQFVFVVWAWWFTSPPLPFPF